MLGFQPLANHTDIAGPLITAIAGIGGVFAGGLITFYTQLTERRLARIREKLDQFYAPMLALRSEIKAKSETRLKLHGIAQKAWQEQLGYLPNPSDRDAFTKERWPPYEKIFRYSEEQLRNELIPLYRRMLDVFTSKMQYAENSTRQHYENLVEFVELWNRHLYTPLPAEVAITADQDESKKLYPLYDDVKQNFDSLRKQLEKSSLWRPSW
jgi:hypothetical protein